MQLSVAGSRRPFGPDLSEPGGRIVPKLANTIDRGFHVRALGLDMGPKRVVGLLSLLAPIRAAQVRLVVAVQLATRRMRQPQVNHERDPRECKH